MSNDTKRMDVNRLVYFVDLYGKKVDLGTKYFMQRVDALLKGDKEKVEYIENMLLKPADMQAEYAAKKIIEVLS